MGTIKLNTLTNKIFIGAFALLILCSFDTSAKKVKFLTSALVPAARGYVKINHDKNLNYIISINISNLAEVYRLEPSKLTYIVWLVTEDGITMNMGKMKSTAGFFSKKLKATFVTATSLKPIKIFITAEDDPSRQYPGNQVVLSTASFTL
jgi:hypothetical protein